MKKRTDTANTGRKAVTDEGDRVQLVLFVVGRTPNSQRAIENLRILKERNLGISLQTEIVDVQSDPERARREQVIAVPSLIRKGNGDERRVVGDLSDITSVIKELNLH